MQLLLSQAEAELEMNELTVAKLLYYMQPTIWIMEVIWHAIGEIHVVSQYINIQLIGSANMFFTFVYTYKKRCSIRRF